MIRATVLAVSLLLSIPAWSASPLKELPDSKLVCNDRSSFRGSQLELTRRGHGLNLKLGSRMPGMIAITEIVEELQRAGILAPEIKVNQVDSVEIDGSVFYASWQKLGCAVGSANVISCGGTGSFVIVHFRDGTPPLYLDGTGLSLSSEQVITTQANLQLNESIESRDLKFRVGFSVKGAKPTDVDRSAAISFTFFEGNCVSSPL